MIHLLLLSLTFPLLTLFIFHRYVKKHQQSPKYPPGPPGLPLIGNLHQFDSSTPHIYLSHLSKKYGPLMSMKFGSIPLLVISSPQAAKEALKTNDVCFSSRPRFLGQVKLSYDRSDIAFAPYGESWRELRKICVLHLLSSKQVQSFRPIREGEVFRVVGDIREGVVVNLSETMLSFTSDLICKVAFGKTEGFRRRRIDELMIESQEMQGGFSFVSDYLPWLGFVDRLTGIMGRLDRVCKDLDEFYQQIIDERLDPRNREMEQSDNILDLLIKLKEEKSSSVDLTWDHVKAILMNIFIAGTDMSAAVIVWTMTALMRNPKSMMKLQKEIREFVKERGRVNEDDLPNLPYLKAVVKESLRLYPPTPLLLPKETLEKCCINGYTIEAKTLVFINVRAIGRDPEYWDCPNEFRPERFMDTDIDVVGQDFELIPFGSGRRGCPGISMGIATVEIVLANLLYAFDWEMPPGMSREDIDDEVLPGLTMHKKIPLSLVPNKYSICI